MRVSMGADYAARAVLDLAQRYGMGPVRSSEIAKRQQIAESFLEQIMRGLRKAGIVRSTRGPRGGHELAFPPSDVTLKAVVEAVDGPCAGPAACMPDDFCVAMRGCVLQDVWRELANAYSAVLGSVTFEQLVQRRAELEARAVYQI